MPKDTLEKMRTIEDISTEKIDAKEKVFFDDKVDLKTLYETDPTKVDHTIIINTCERAFILPRYGSQSTICMKQGDRIKGEYYARIVSEDINRLPGLQLAHKLTEEFLKQLEKIRKKNSNEEPSQLVKEIWSMKGKTDEADLRRDARKKR